MGNKKTPSWVFVTIEVWSRLWPSTVTGRRSYRNTHALFRDLSKRMNFGRLPLIVTDGFEFYQKVIRRFFGPACLYGQVLKTRRNDRIIKVERRALHGAAWRDDALNNSDGLFDIEHVVHRAVESDHPAKLGIPFEIEHFPTLARRRGLMSTWSCSVAITNFVRPHGALKFGRADPSSGYASRSVPRDGSPLETSSWRRRFLCGRGSRFSCSLGGATRSLPHLYHCPQPRSNT